MSRSDLPTFRYHPDPVGTGSFVATRDRCPYCGSDRTYVYDGPVYAIEEPDPPCPKCIADGSFAARFDAEFTDSAPLAGLDAEIIDEVTRRTPGYSGWQVEQWMTHCDDAATFLGPVGYQELLGHPEAMEQLRRELGDGGCRASRGTGRPPPTCFDAVTVGSSSPTGTWTDR